MIRNNDKKNNDMKILSVFLFLFYRNISIFLLLKYDYHQNQNANTRFQRTIMTKRKWYIASVCSLLVFLNDERCVLMQRRRISYKKDSPLNLSQNSCWAIFVDTQFVRTCVASHMSSADEKDKIS